MVVVEGVARKLDPQLNMWSTSEPVVGAWIAENLGPRERIEDIARKLSSVAGFLAEAPRRLDELANLLDASARIQAEFSPANRRRAERVVLWAAVFLLFLIALYLWHR
jgi:ubiquinone biosynthesis protein